MEQPDRQVEKRNRRLITTPQALSLGFLLVIIGVLFFTFSSTTALHKGPYSEHMWRQSDGHATTYNLYLDSSTFLQPRTLDLDMGIEARGGLEFQMMYYLSAQWDQFRGHYSSATSNWFHYLFLLLAFILFMARMIWTASFPYRYHILIIPLLGLGVWTSGLWQYYGMNNFPDVAAIASALIGFILFEKSITSNQKLYWLGSILFFLLSCLFKVTFLIYPLSLFGAHFLFPGHQKWRGRYLIASTVIIAIVYGWIRWMKSYNATYESNGFLTSFLPYNSVDAGQKQWIWDRLTDEYFPLMLQWEWTTLFCILFLINIVCNPFREKLVQVAMLLGLLIYFFLFYAQFSVHSYYLVILYPFVLINLYHFVQFHLNHWPREKISQVILTGLVVLLLYQQAGNTQSYLRSNYNPQNAHHSYLDIPPEFLDEDRLVSIFDELEIPQNAKIISIADVSTNVSLHTCKRYGWSLTKEEFRPERIEKLIRSGATYLVYWGPHEPLFYQDKPLSSLYKFETGTTIYSLQD